MKKILFILASILLLASCKSREEKVAELIKDNMFKTLYDFSSYEPIESKIDSAFTSVYTDSITLEHGQFIKIYLDKLNSCIEEMEDANETIKIWNNGYYSSYAHSKIKEARKKAMESYEEAKKNNNLIELHSISIKDRAKSIERIFYGWKVTHKFRCKTKGGNPDIGNFVYVFDKEIKSIIYKEDLDNEDNLRVKDLIEEALNREFESEETDSITIN